MGVELFGEDVEVETDVEVELLGVDVEADVNTKEELLVLAIVGLETEEGVLDFVEDGKVVSENGIVLREDDVVVLEDGVTGPFIVLTWVET